MKPATHRRLTELREKTDKEYGKLVQKLLAIALLETGVERLVERSIQGVDLEVRIAGRPHALEVKTCEADELKFGKKDLDGMARVHGEGAQTYAAVLGGGLFDDWLLARFHPGEWRSGVKVTTWELRAFRDHELEERVAPAFERVVERHFTTALEERQTGLDRVLAEYPARELA